VVYGPGLPETCLPPARYAEIMRIPLPHFHQMAGPLAPLTGGCDTVWDQDDREALVWVMQQAERMIATELGYWPSPVFVTDESLHLGLDGARSDWQNAEIETNWKHVEAFGTEELTLVEADALVDWQDWDSDPRLTLEVAVLGAGGLYEDLTACDSNCEVAVFFRAEDGALSAAHPHFEIRPVRVAIDSTTDTMEVWLPAAQLIKPTLWNLTEAECAASDDTEAWVYTYDPGDTTANLVRRVDVYCRTVDTETPVTVYWDGVCACTSVCSHQTQTACAYVTDAKRGFFCARPATWNGTANIYQAALYSTPPESAVVNYRAGYPLDTVRCRMDRSLERAIVKLTNALLPEPPCGYCDAAMKLWERDRAPVDPLTPEAAGLPWDLYSQGALDAWRIVKMFAMGRGSKLGR